MSKAQTRAMIAAAIANGSVKVQVLPPVVRTNWNGVNRMKVQPKRAR